MMAWPRGYVLIVFFLVVLCGATILGPAIYEAAGLIAPIPFHRAMDRALLVSAVGALFLFGARIPLGELWPREGAAGAQLLLGFFIAAVTVQGIIGCDLAFSGFTGAHLDVEQVAGRWLLALTAALLASPLEEMVFRGFIQRELEGTLGWRAGWVGAAALFTMAHFLKTPVELDRQPVHFWSGLGGVGAAFLPLIHGDFFSGRGLNLFLLGLVLGGVFLRSGALWVNAGLHGGLILGLLLFTGLTRPMDPPRVALFGGDILSSLSTTVVLVVLGLWLWRYYRHPSVLPETGPTAR